MQFILPSYPENGRHNNKRIK